MAVSKKEIGDCPIDATLSVIDGRWKGTILWRLCDGPMRTAELRRSIPDITERMLIRHLHELVADGIIDRHDAGTIPPCVHYSISEYGMTLAPVLQSLCDWGRVHMRRETRKAQPRKRAAAPTSPASPPSAAGTTRISRRKSSPA
ncbi:MULTISPECIES: winged helix-turn-helix transcriptional regulator [Mycolicibacterium]|uniref:HTH hxlR-type domain-containing protein n=1 Tax=Mycolicibacterium mageritense TaxID=53462 RepID=A0AAI8TW39_MYCME|nr:helix-turn-helix domain-containing protein [Mycolicibacterium mageritense]MBN3452464.1 helix-turn-helix transcriptional regulator [Mycobacterium sp. DSM 3803]OKH73040.1 HxlR family transcriptional regulator [Mycobacterium sp. SWH-M3]MCC9183119.1 helix-turn-helix transcriptional regulator [Mycolicibacterium mageritense]TXI63706.1 MAG: transcriptional regulator [Mycolicibacterium mageritense]CDO20550.1 HxlR family transcriptional regulator [Mycolicibacterium mageritense DSM 44476 = CIP 104973